LEYVVWIARRRWKYENGLPALNVSAGDVEEVFGPTAAASNGQVTAMELYKGLMGAGMDTEPHNIIGPAAAEYDNIVREETDRFNLDQQDLVVTIRRIVSRANEAIANAK
jgi:multiple sugar transport system substrate-binding protein